MEGLKGISLLLLLSAGVLLAMSVLAEDAEGATITVPDDYPTINSAIENATDDDTILVKDGVYNESVIVWRPLTLKGESRDGTILESGDDFALLVASNRVHVSNLTVRNYSDFTFAYIHQGTRCIVEDVVVRDSGNGIWVNRAYGNVFRRVECLDNHEVGLWMDESDDNRFEKVVCRGNGWDGARVFWSDGNTFTRCSLVNNTGQGIHTDISANGAKVNGLEIISSSLSGNGLSGALLYHAEGLKVTGCSVRDNARSGLFVWYSNDTVIRDNQIENYVRFGIAYDGGWSSGGVIIENNSVVDEGAAWSDIMVRYAEDVLIASNQVNALSSPISVGSVNDTVIRSNVLTSTNDDPSHTSIGIVVSRGRQGQGQASRNVTIEDCEVRNYSNGLHMRGGVDVHVTGCTFEADSAGIYLEDWGLGDVPLVDGVIEDCELIGCGMDIEGMEDSTVQDNMISGTDVGIHFNASSYPIRNNVFRANVIMDCSEHGMFFNATNGTNRFHLNTFKDNGAHSNSPSDADFFDDGTMYGNYWDDYVERYPDAALVGRVWDTPYGVGGGDVVDNYPLAFVYDTIDPIADAGEQQGGDAGYTYTLNGTGSWDDGVIVMYTWTFTYADTPVELTGEVAKFLFLLVGSYEVTLEVEDAWGNTDTNVTMVHVHDLTDPTADAGDDVEVGMGEAFLLNGSRSSDNGIIISWVWSIDPEGLDRTLEGETATFSIDRPGEYPVVLRVTDEAGNWDVDDMLVTVLDTEDPIADAGRDFSADQGDTVTLSGRWSRDNVGVTTWTWTFAENGEVMIEVGENVERAFPHAGTYKVHLNVTDAAGNWDVDNVTLTVRDTEPPAADAGLDVTVDQGTLVTFDGGNSTDNVGVVVFNWLFAEGSLLKNIMGVDATYRFDHPGEYEVELQAYDQAGNVGLDWMIVTVADTSKELILGPFKDEDGPLGGVRVEADFGAVYYTGYTDDDGVVSIMVISPDDLVSPGSVVAEKEGWMTLEFEMELDANGDPIGSIPLMKRSGGGDDDDDDDEIDWLAWGLVIVLIIAYAGTLLYLSNAAKRAGDE
jgi:nitrous oxidase accessory protein NosD